jgi:hypothetical protein
VITVLALLAVWLQGTFNFLGMGEARSGLGVPAGWNVRRVRGHDAPQIEIRQDEATLVVRIHGSAQAAWFYRELPVPVREAAGSLTWTWRVLEAPHDADLRWKQTDDSPLRIFVVFGHPGRLLNRSGRIIFYSFGSVEPEGYEGASHAGDRYHIIRVDGASDRLLWRDHVADPFADYRRIWHRNPPPITAVGVMQDTDQTNQPAVAELRRLEWISR